MDRKRGNREEEVDAGAVRTYKGRKRRTINPGFDQRYGPNSGVGDRVPPRPFLGPLDVFDDQGRIIHDGGVVNAPGVYVLGATFLRRRRSSFIHGAPSDTDDLAAHLCDYLLELNKSKV